MKESNLLIISKMGRAIKVKASDFPLQKRRGIGIVAMTLKEGDEIVTAIKIEEKERT
jgi:DNA gyrase/topoisomerase IV subunit A